MAPLLQIDSLSKSFGERVLFSDVSFSVSEGDKIGFIAKNGSGKTTLLNIISNKEGYDSGKIVFRNDVRVSMLEQSPHFDSDLTVTQFMGLISQDEEIRNNFVKLVTQINDGLSMDDRFKTMSGGQKKRVALAASLSVNPELLILDEPTNHLDIKTIEWLENYLSRSRQTLLMVTHDRYFLDRVCNRIIEIDRERIYTYPGNYAKYLEARQHRIDVMTAELEKVKNTLRREQEWMSRQPQARATKAQYRIDQYHELKERSKIRLKEEDVSLRATSTYIGNKIFHAEKVEKKFADKYVLRDFTYDFARYDKIGLVGSNGVGKTTFVKMLLGLVKPDSGFFDVGSTVKFGYYSQNRAVFDPQKKVIDVVCDIAEDIELGGQRVTALQYLQHFLFNAKDQQKRISTLSGGELSRLYLATVLMKRPNFLILDEPTNDLDIVTLGILEEYLVDFKGCAIIVSHDRYFLDNIVDHIFVMEGDGIVKDFPGNYSDYRTSQSKKEEPQNPKKTDSLSKQKPKTERPAKLTFQERRELETLNVEIEELTKERYTLETLFNNPSNDQDLTALTTRYKELKEELDIKELRWLELSEKT